MPPLVARTKASTSLESTVASTSAWPESVPHATCPAESELPWCQVVGDVASPQLARVSLLMSLVNELAVSALLANRKILAAHRTAGVGVLSALQHRYHRGVKRSLHVGHLLGRAIAAGVALRQGAGKRVDGPAFAVAVPRQAILPMGAAA